jgi:predicted TIM-barrel fold metal-dependent hydrolase
MWGSDYPHEESTYPHSRETVNRLFSGIPEDQARMIVGGTAAKLFRFKPSVLEDAL